MLGRVGEESARGSSRRHHRQTASSPALWLGATAALSVLLGRHATHAQTAEELYPYLGCFKDGHPRVLPTQIAINADELTLARCASDCLAASTTPTYEFCGLEFGQECFCGSGNYSSLGPADCNMYYDESTGIETGDRWAISVYDLRTAAASSAMAATAPSPSTSPSPSAAGGNTDVGGSGDLSPVASGDRTFTVVNNCNKEIRIGSTGGRITFGDGIDASLEEPCLAWGPSAVWNPGPMGQGCYWDLPDEDGGNTDRMLGAGESFRYTLHPTESDTRWSGTIWASTGCDLVDGCATGVCYSPTTEFVCPAYVGPGGPTTKAEFTLSDGGMDYYDVSAIDGVNLPMEISPDSPYYPQDTSIATILKYRCGSPGAVTSPTGLAGCSWSYEDYVPTLSENLSVYLRMVLPPDYEDDSNVCSKNADCNTGICGVHPQRWADGSYRGGVKQGACGDHIAWVSAGGACAGGWVDGEFPDAHPFYCGESVTNGQRANMYGCHGGALAHSGYTPGADATACGCPDWESESINAPAISECAGINSEWVSKAQPFAQHLKKACPTAYTFPYDDQTSTFMCADGDTSPDGFVNTQSYTITFCPGDSEDAMYP